MSTSMLLELIFCLLLVTSITPSHSRCSKLGCMLKDNNRFIYKETIDSPSPSLSPSKQRLPTEGNLELRLSQRDFSMSSETKSIDPYAQYMIQPLRANPAATAGSGGVGGNGGRGGSTLGRHGGNGGMGGSGGHGDRYGGFGGFGGPGGWRGGRVVVPGLPGHPGTPGHPDGRGGTGGLGGTGGGVPDTTRITT